MAVSTLQEEPAAGQVHSPQRRHPQPKPIRKTRGVFERPAGSGCWWILYFDELGNRHREKVGLKQAAISAYQQRKTEIRQGKFIPEEVQRKKVSLDQIVNDYLESCQARKVKDVEEITTRAQWWKSHFQGRSAKSITASDVEGARKVLSHMKPYGHGYTRKAKTLAAATINKYFAILKAAYFLALRNGKVDRNPVSQVKMLKENNARVRYLSKEEEDRLFEILPTEYHAMVRIAIHTGLRRMELFKLKWTDVNFQQLVITIGESKTGEARTVPLNDIAVGALKGIVRRIDNPYVFPGTKPGTYRTDLPKSWKRFLELAGIENFRWHDLRHTFGSRLVMAGVDLYTVSKLLGHHGIKMTERYAHLSPGHLAQAVSKLVKPEPSATKTATGQQW